MSVTIGMVDDATRRELESAIRTAGRSGDEWLDVGLDPLLARPGKRLRPALVFAAASCGPDTDMAMATTAAASVELMHISSLIHDDLMDDSSSRGGLTTLHVSGGRAAAILGGDYLLAAGGRLAAEVSGLAAQLWHRGYGDLCAGQVRETANRFRIDAPVTDYLAAVRGKTAALMRTACQLGGLCTDLTGAQRTALAEFGTEFGIVFQLVDDLMDVVSTERLWTKPVEQDLPNGVYTACVLAALRDPRSGIGGLLSDSMTPQEIDLAHDLARRYGVGAALGMIHDHAGQADAALAALPDSPARAWLAALPRQYVSTVLETKVAPGHRRWLTGKAA